MARENLNTGTIQSALAKSWEELFEQRAHIDKLLIHAQEIGDLRPVTEAVRDLQVRTCVYDELRREREARLRALLGRSFLGAEEWKRGFQVEVGRPPPIPDYISEEFLQSECLLHPGFKIKDTHILFLLPRRVNSEPLTARLLAELCLLQQDHLGPVVSAIHIWANKWKNEAWAWQFPDCVDWLLMPKSDPDRKKMPAERHFRGKSIAEQDLVRERFYKDYVDASALQQMVKVVLNYVVNRERLSEECFLSTRESNAYGGRVYLGHFSDCGIWLNPYCDAKDYARTNVGRALVFKPPQAR